MELKKEHRDLLLNMAASGSVGAACVGALNPLDTVRIRWQTKGSDIMAGGTAAATVAEVEAMPAGISSFAKRIIARQGLVQGLWYPGLGANCAAICLSTGFRLGKRVA